jgi:ribosomal protein L11 methyltransferase
VPSGAAFALATLRPTIVFVIALDRPEQFEIASAFAFACGATGAESLFGPEREIWRFYFSEAGAAEDAVRIWRDRLGIDARIERLRPPADPLAAFRAAARPRPVGRSFWLAPGDVLEPAPGGRIALHLPASTAFGTGGHESTRLAIRRLEEEVLDGLRVLDLGSGSGVLALAASALGAGSVHALDLDADAVFEARRNLLRNPVAARGVHLLAGGLESLAGVYDLAVANMLFSELSPLLAGIGGRLAGTGRAVFSGLLAEQRREFVALCAEAGFAVDGEAGEGEWIAIAARRG